MTAKAIRRNKTSPAITLPILAKGERYAGLLLDDDGAPTQHLILLPGELESGTWTEAGAWAKKIKGALPTRQEQSLLFANLKKHFQSAAYWSSAPYAGDDSYAWYQYFDNGGQDYDRQYYELRARAVRRVAI